MDIRFEHDLRTREFFIAVMEELETARLNMIPAGFSNNVIWNIIHCMVTLEGLTYGLSGLDQYFPKGTILQFKHGTKPERDLSASEITDFKNQLTSQSQRLQEDYTAGKFEHFKEHTTSTGYLLRNIDDALSLVNIHEGIHLGYILALKKATSLDS